MGGPRRPAAHHVRALRRGRWSRRRAAAAAGPGGRVGDAQTGRLDHLGRAGRRARAVRRRAALAHPQLAARTRRLGDSRCSTRPRRAGLPTMGICRGMQLMAVRAGGALEQHVPDVVGHDEHSPAPDAFGWVSITTQPDSLVRQLVGDRLQVNCHHHQAVATHPGFEVTARAADGTDRGDRGPRTHLLAGRAVASRVRRRPRPVPRARPSRCLNSRAWLGRDRPRRTCGPARAGCFGSRTVR